MRALLALLPLVARKILDPEHVAHVSPYIAVYQLIQFVSLFHPSLGDDWPPLLRGLFEKLSVIASLSIDDLNTECAIGTIIVPQSLAGCVVAAP